MTFSRLLEELFPFMCYVRRRNHLLQRSESDRILDSEAFAGYGTLSEEELQNRLSEERQRAQSMDEKTFKLTLSFSVGLAVFGLTTTSVARNMPYVPIQGILITLVGLGLLFVLSAGFIALGALRTFPSYGYGTAFMVKIRKTEKTEAVLVLAAELARQETMNNIRHLRNEAAYQTLRNGLFLFFVGVMLSLAALGIQKLPPEFGMTQAPQTQMGDSWVRYPSELATEIENEGTDNPVLKTVWRSR